MKKLSLFKNLETKELSVRKIEGLKGGIASVFVIGAIGTLVGAVGCKTSGSKDPVCKIFG